ncbi:MAG TPA: DUF559 domain-containing protein [Gemmataceae bacterium]|nr:DUF559 domain-containing protein [Gemmataceae bacterium]
MARIRKIGAARSQRQANIPAEKLLWRELRNRALSGFKFRRQHPINSYVVDFACYECKLIIEVDGESHLSTCEKDTKRTETLGADGWLVLRFWNTEIYDDLEPVKEMIYRTCVERSQEVPPSPPAPLPPPTTVLPTTRESRRGERGADTTLLLILVACLLLGFNAAAHGQTPSYAKQIRPFIAKYCLECHNAKTMRGELNLETYKAMMEGVDGGPVIVPGQPDKSKLVLLCEGKPKMPPAKAKFHPSKDEVAQLRAWVAAGARDDGAEVKVVLPAIKAKTNTAPPVTAMSYNPKRNRLVFARGRELTVVDLKANTQSTTNPLDHFGYNLSFDADVYQAFAKDGIITALSQDGDAGAAFFSRPGAGSAALFFRFDKPFQVFATYDHTDSIQDAATSWTIATAGSDSKIVIPLGRKKHVLKEHSDAVYGITFSPDAKQLASVSADRAMKVFDVDKGKLLYTLGEATDWLYAVAWSPNGKYLVSGGVDKSIRVYEPTPTGAKIRQSVFAHEGAVLKLVFSSDSKTLYSVGEDRVVKAWDVEKMVECKVYDRQPESVLCLALREDAGQIIVGRYDGIVQLIDMKTGKVAHEFGKEKALTPNPSPKRRGEKEAAKPRDERSDSRGSNPQHSLISFGHPSKKSLPSEIAGKLGRAGAVQFHRINVKAGESLGVRIQTAELKSKLDPVLILTDAAGNTLAESTQGHLGYTFAKAGTYAIGVRDRDYRGGNDFTYRLQLGELPIVTEVFPLSLPRGMKGDIQLDGVFLPKRVISFAMPADAKPGQVFKLDVGNALGKAEIVAGEFPAVTAGAKIPVPGAAHGRLTRDNQKDLWSFAAKKGQRLIVETHARRFGSRLDTIIEILDKDGQPVPRTVLRSQAKTHVTFRDHDSAQGNIRIEAWSELGTNDYLFVGTELMKIKALPTHPDADCNFFAAAGQRVGYLDTTPTHHANGTPMYKVSVHPPGTAFPPNGYPVFTLYYKNDDGGPGFGRDSRIVFDPPADGEYKVRVSDARGMGGVNFGYRLTVRHPRESFTLKATPTTPIVSKGGATSITFTAERIDGFDGPIRVRAKDLPAGFHLPETTIEAGDFTATVALYAEANAKAVTGKLRFEGSTTDTSIPFSLLGDIDLPKLIEPGDIVTTTAESAVSLKAGEQAKLLVRIERRNGFKGRVPLDVRGLPHGVRVLDIGLNGILVNENETTRTVVIYAEPWVQSQEHPFVVLARREGKNSEHAAKSVLLKITSR